MADAQRIGPMSTNRPYASVLQRSDVYTQSGPMSPRHDPTETFRFERLIVVGSQSTSHVAGFARLLDHVFFRTRH